MKTTTVLNVLIAATLLIGSGATIAQDEGRSPLYLSVDCMKSTAPDYTGVELEIWQPMHQELVNQGRRNSWALYWVMYGDRSRCDFYTVTTYLGEEQLNADPGYIEVFEEVHPDKILSKEMAKTWASRQHVSSELWVLVDSTELKTHRFAVVNTMYAEDSDAYERMESSVFKAGHQALVDGGHRAGWGVYALVSPTGSSVPYNYSTVDLVNHLSPVPMATAMMVGNPDRDLDEMQDLLALRDHVRSETWTLVATTTDTPAE